MLFVISKSLPIGIAIGVFGFSPFIFIVSLIDVSRFVALTIKFFSLKLKRAHPNIGRVDLVGTTLIVF